MDTAWKQTSVRSYLLLPASPKDVLSVLQNKVGMKDIFVYFGHGNQNGLSGMNWRDVVSASIEGRSKIDIPLVMILGACQSGAGAELLASKGIPVAYGFFDPFAGAGLEGEWGKTSLGAARVAVEGTLNALLPGKTFREAETTGNQIWKDLMTELQPSAVAQGQFKMFTAKKEYGAMTLEGLYEEVKK